MPATSIGRFTVVNRSAINQVAVDRIIDKTTTVEVAWSIKITNLTAAGIIEVTRVNSDAIHAVKIKVVVKIACTMAYRWAIEQACLVASSV